MKLQRIIWWIVCLGILPVSCGKYSETKVKNYGLHFYSAESSLLKAGQRLVTDYNRMAGAPVLAYISSENDANSYVQFVHGLNASDGKLAYGQWVTETSEEPFTRSLQGHILEKTVNYSMNLQFDYNYYKARAAAASDSIEWKTLFVLFCHEVGHGLTMDDIYDKTQKSQIMYGIISEDDIPTKDFKTYYDRVHSFLADQ